MNRFYYCNFTLLLFPMKYFIHELDNGIRTVFRHSDSAVAHIGLIIGAGSRDEEKSENGMAHFIEHCIFKGTRKRKAFHILSYLENIGGELNAFTTREETCIHASVPVKFVERALELLLDVFTNSTFPKKEIEKEKDVIVEEIQYYRDLPDEIIIDDFEEMVFRGHSMGRHILGTPENIITFNKEKLTSFIQKNYNNQSTVLSCVGSIQPEKWIKLAERYFSGIKRKPYKNHRKAFKNYQPFESKSVRKINQTHCVMGALAYPYDHEKRIPMVLLNNILGGPSNNSRLNMSVRERHGLSYNIESNYIPYSDTGVFFVYMGVENGSADRAIRLVKKEMAQLSDKGLGSLQLSRAKQQLIGQIAMARESNLGEMLSMGKSLLIYGHVDTFEAIQQRINGLTEIQLKETAGEIFDPGKLSSLIFASE
jgi:predicted Zn-dependent peptidase